MAKIDKVQEVAISELVPYERNAKIHSEEQVRKIADSITEFGFLSPCIIDKDYNVIAGHGRIEASKLLGMEKVPCLFVDGLSEEQRKAYILADNKLTELGSWDMDLVLGELKALDNAGFNTDLTGFEFQQDTAEKESRELEEAKETLKDRFLIPPFSIFDTRTALWLDRVRAWKRLGIKSEIGRGNDTDKTENGLTFAKSHQPPSTYRLKNEYEEMIGEKVSWNDFFEKFPESAKLSGTSIFNPVLCEVAYRWFSKVGGRVIDPFAGGSVRGIVASLLGREYVGIDLSERQINANKDNWEEVPHESIIDGADVVNPTWITGDSLHIDELIDGEFDLLFSCPPYADLEKYSDKAEDLSNMEYDDFLDTYRKIIKKSVDMLKPNSFAIFVVGDVRDKKGNYHNFIGDTVEAFKDAGMSYYNEVIVITQFGSIAMCCTKPFNTSRKVSKAHQNFLVFIKDNKNIEKINLEDSEKQEKDINNIIEKYNSDIAVTHEKMLVFTKGSPQKASEELGEVDTSTNDEFIVNLD